AAGEYPEGSLNRRICERLIELAEHRQSFSERSRRADSSAGQDDEEGDEGGDDDDENGDDDGREPA
ncbi:MAG: hypothetical protein MUE63_11070, partial [Xanthomonadales bacterium]|nr:hypothetical protein [Xanthomonadales bacterium]